MVNIASSVHKFKYACLLVCLLSSAVSGCAAAKLNQAREAFYNGHLEQAAKDLSSSDDVSNRDQLLYYMEKGTILYYDGDYQGSIDLLLNAAALIKEQEVISASQQTASLVTTEWLTDYKGEYAERLLVHTYLMMNFLMIGNHESALVEAKQALEVYDTYPDACRDDYFTRALIAHCFEAMGEINDAYIEYKKLAELLPDPSPVAAKLCELGSRLGFDDEVEHFRQFIPASELKRKATRSAGELIVFVSQGRSPVKVPQNIVIPPSIRFSFSTYQDRSSYLPPPSVGPLAGSGPAGIVTTDVGQVLKTSLKDRLTQIIAKETARVVAKEAIAHNMNNDNLELLVRIVFFLTEVPDTRCWQTLPAELSMVRIPLSPGDNPIRLNGMQQTVTLPEIDATAGSRSFYHYFSIRSGTGPLLSGKNPQSDN